MFEAPLLLAFTAGMVASVNPCAFSLLPAYVGLFVAGEEAARPLEERMLRAIGVAASVSLGFVVVFGLAGIALDAMTGALRQKLPWVTIAVGAALVVAGVAVVAGWKPRLAAGGLRFGSSGRGFVSMVGFGATYAVASLSCTIGPFLAVTGAALNQSAFGGIVTYVAYALGMGVIILMISIGAVTSRSAAGMLRRVSRFAPRLGGVLMVIAGLYGIWYGRWELAVYGGDLSTDPVIDAGEELRLRVVAAVESVGALRLAAVVVGVVAASIAAGAALRAFTRPSARAGAAAATTSEPDVETALGEAEWR